MSLISPTWWDKLPNEWRLGIIIVGLGLVLALVGFGFYACSGTGVPAGKGANLLVNESVSAGKNAVEANLIANQQKEVDNAEIIANQANANLANSQRQDSSTFNGKLAPDHYCRDFPNDSSCRR